MAEQSEVKLIEELDPVDVENGNVDDSAVDSVVDSATGKVTFAEGTGGGDDEDTPQTQRIPITDLTLGQGEMYISSLQKDVGELAEEINKVTEEISQHEVQVIQLKMKKLELMEKVTSLKSHQSNYITSMYNKAIKSAIELAAEKMKADTPEASLEAARQFVINQKTFDAESLATPEVPAQASGKKGGGRGRGRQRKQR
jgi:hypothetical protein